jgi:hypothetical protein
MRGDLWILDLITLGLMDADIAFIMPFFISLGCHVTHVLPYTTTRVCAVYSDILGCGECTLYRANERRDGIIAFEIDRARKREEMRETPGGYLLNHLKR